jgi:hypothetical protein
MPLTSCELKWAIQVTLNSLMGEGKRGGCTFLRKKLKQFLFEPEEYSLLKFNY